jgi:ABC-type lipoprotein export system ATPase subunit
MTAPVIELRGLARTYPGPPPVHALRPADLVIEAGDYIAVTGPSGSGKSTLLGLNSDGLTIVVITHDAAVAAHAGRTVAISDGILSERTGAGHA